METAGIVRKIHCEDKLSCFSLLASVSSCAPCPVPPGMGQGEISVWDWVEAMGEEKAVGLFQSWYKAPG